MSETYLLEEVISLVVDKDECREILDMNLPYSLHPELRIFDAFYGLDVVLRKYCRRTAKSCRRAGFSVS